MKFEWAQQIWKCKIGIPFPRGGESENEKWKVRSELTFVSLVKIKNSFLPHFLIIIIIIILLLLTIIILNNNYNNLIIIINNDNNQLKHFNNLQ